MGHPVFERRSRGSRPLLGTMVTYEALDNMELQSQLGPDFVIIDCQHSLISESAARRLIYASHTPSTAIMVRVSSADPYKIGSVLDAGADAVIVPMVNTAQEARVAVAACRYGPAGIRSLGATRRSLPADPRALEDRASCFVMVETVEGVNNLEEICCVPGLSGIFLGSGDLAVTMGEPLFANPSTPALRMASRKVAAACQAVGLIAGAYAGPAARAKELIDDGFDLLAIGIDWLYVRSGICANLEEIQKYLASPQETGC
ncbi:MAG: HpcH/HpaI aldolase family protein [Steroidobacteraceae bacterium]